MLTADQFIKSKIVETGYRFGAIYGGGPIAGQMVMQVLANRFRAGWGGSWMGVLDGVANYMAESELPPFKLPSIWEPSFVKLLHTVDSAYDGSLRDDTKGALYWADLNKIERSWFQEKIVSAVSESTGLRAHPLVANMNSLSFFR